MKILKSQKEFNKLKQEKDCLLLDFGASWCNPCSLVKENLEEIEEVYEDVLFLKIDIEKFPEIADDYSVSSIPQINLIVKGESKGKVVGADIKAILKLLSTR